MGRGRKVGDRSDYITLEEMDKLFSVVSKDQYFFTLYSVLRYSGRRIGEIYGTLRGKNIIGGMQVKDIDWNANSFSCYVLKTKKRKIKLICPSCGIKSSIKGIFCMRCGTKLPEIDPESLKYTEPKRSIVRMKPEHINILKRYIDDNKLSNEDYIFRKYNLIYIKRKIHQHVKEAGIKKKFTLHGFRHYFVTKCKFTMTNEQIALLTGHVRPETLNIYTHITPDDINDKFNAVDL